MAKLEELGVRPRRRHPARLNLRFQGTALIESGFRYESGISTKKRRSRRLIVDLRQKVSLRKPGQRVPSYLIFLTPFEKDGRIYLQHIVNGAGVGGFFKLAALAFIQDDRDPDSDSNLADAARRVCHLLLDVRGGTGDVNS